MKRAVLAATACALLAGNVHAETKSELSACYADAVRLCGRHEGGQRCRLVQTTGDHGLHAGPPQRGVAAVQCCFQSPRKVSAK